MKGKGSGKVSSSVKSGAVALVFLIIGFQTALFIHRASVLAIVDRRDSPDTVYVIDSGLAASVLASADEDVRDKAVSVKTSQKEDRTKPSGERIAVRKETVHLREAEKVYYRYSDRKAESFRFNPNTASVEEFMRLGFSEKQALSIDSYRRKGGRFRRKSDFAKSYVVADSVYNRLEPFIDIPLLDLNRADSAAFDSLPGIGGYFASRMVAYRKELGGAYSYKEQLMDIWRFDKDRFDSLSDLICIDTASIKPYPLWTLPEDSLRLHPYIGAYSAHGIVVFRENSPRSSWSVDALAKAGVINPENAGKLLRCVITAP